MAEMGEQVTVHSVGRLKDGLKFLDTRKSGSPIRFTLGDGSVLAAFEAAVMQLSPGQTRTFEVPAAQAYGEYDPSFIECIPADALPGADELPVGQFIEVGMPDGPVRVKVLPQEKGMVRLDHNHELAGKDLLFEIELVSVGHEDAVEREKHGAGCACGCHRLKESLEAE